CPAVATPRAGQNATRAPPWTAAPAGEPSASAPRVRRVEEHPAVGGPTVPDDGETCRRIADEHIIELVRRELHPGRGGGRGARHDVGRRVALNGVRLAGGER